MTTWEDGRAGFVYCGNCGELVIRTHLGFDMLLSRKSVPSRDAQVLAKYGKIVVHIWQNSWGKLFSSMSIGDKPKEGRLYVEHMCRFKPWRNP